MEKYIVLKASRLWCWCKSSSWDRYSLGLNVKLPGPFDLYVAPIDGLDSLVYDTYIDDRAEKALGTKKLHGHLTKRGWQSTWKEPTCLHSKIRYPDPEWEIQLRKETRGQRTLYVCVKKPRSQKLAAVPASHWNQIFYHDKTISFFANFENFVSRTK